MSACANGHLKLWDVTSAEAFPIQSYAEHTHEAVSVNWNVIDRAHFCSGSWDRTVKIWIPHRHDALRTLHGHRGPVYNAVWSAQSTSLVASCSGDGSLRIWDLLVPSSSAASAAVCRIPAHANEVIALDWNKYDANALVSGSVDGSIKIWVFSCRYIYQRMPTIYIYVI